MFQRLLCERQKDKLRIAVGEKCGKSVDTVQAWMLDYRKPSRLEAEALHAYIKDNFQVEIIEES